MMGGGTTVPPLLSPGTRKARRAFGRGTPCRGWRRKNGSTTPFRFLCRRYTLAFAVEFEDRWTMLLFWKRKHSEKSMGLGRLPYQTLVRLGLYQFG